VRLKKKFIKLVMACSIPFRCGWYYCIPNVEPEQCFNKTTDKYREKQGFIRSIWTKKQNGW